MSDYSIGIKELDDVIGGIRKGSNIMLIGPPMSPKEVILYNIMSPWFEYEVEGGKPRINLSTAR
jgi:KaiC/GvpD/RAD55 family RecA-like ATPase